MTQRRILELAYATALNEWAKEREIAKHLPEECQDRVKKAHYELKTIEKLLKAEDIDVLEDVNVMKEYRVQAILIDETGRNTIETVVDSFKTTDYKKTLDMVMQRHKTSSSYLYIVMDIETQNVIYKSKYNKYHI